MTTVTAPTCPRLFAGIEDGPSFRAHLDRFGDRHTFKDRRVEGFRTLQQLLDDAPLIGKGGGGIAASLKLAFLATSTKPVIVVNAMEGEPASSKGVALAMVAPHLVLDGALMLAEALNGTQIIIAIADDDTRTTQGFQRAIGERRESISMEISHPPAHYVSGEESALVHWLDEGSALPTFRPVKPSFVKIGRRAALVHNLETLAHLALLARFGAGWYRSRGTSSSPGTTLITVSGAVQAPSTYEWTFGRTLGELIEQAGGLVEGFGGALLGGYGGTWVGGNALSLPIDHEGLRSVGATLGPGIVVVLPKASCPIAEVTRVVEWMANESVGQCGPCVYGLPALAKDLRALGWSRSTRNQFDRLLLHLTEVDGRGACRHPDGVVRLIRTCLSVFSAHFDEHLRSGPCAAVNVPTVMVLPKNRRR